MRYRIAWGSNTLLACLLLATLSACGGGGGSSSDSASSSGATTSSATSSAASSSTSTNSSSAASSSGSTSSSSSSAASSATQSTLGGGFATPTAGGLPIYDSNGNITGSTLTGARVKFASSLQDMIDIVAAARVDDAGKKVTSGAYPLLIVYSGNEDALIAQIIKDQTPDSITGVCPVPHWDDAYREVSLKDYTAGITIIGTNGSSANFGITVVNSGNVIIRNMKIGALGGANNDADMLRIDNSPNVWIDHNELFAANHECEGSPDGDLTFESAIDIKKNSDNITVSYNYIHDSKKVGLDGHTVSSGVADYQRHITYHHNLYSNVNGRLPLQRGGWIHAYNNLYTGITGSGINVRSGGNALIERNWFENSLNPVTCRFDTVNCGYWDLRDNNLTSSADNATYNITWDSAGSGGINADSWATTGTFPLTLPYTYTAETPQCVKDNLAKAAGVSKGFAALSCS